MEYKDKKEEAKLRERANAFWTDVAHLQTLLEKLQEWHLQEKDRADGFTNSITNR